MRLCIKILGRLVSLCRIFLLRLRGYDISFRAVIAPRCSFAGRVSIAARACIEDGVTLEGNIRIGKGAVIQSLAVLKGNVSVGDQSVVGRYSILTTMPEGRLRIGRDVLVNSFSKLGASKLVEIGDHAIFASFVEITDASHGYEDPAVLIKHAPFESAPVKIGSNVWLGSGTVVMRGVTIGDGAVVGAKSLVNKDIPANGIAFGVPAQLTRRRGERSTIKSQ